MNKENTEKRIRIAADAALRQARQRICKNSKLDYELKNGKPEWSNDGCDNPRRSSSAYCVECSEAHKQIQN